MKIYSFTRNKYLYSVLAFLIWIIFFDSNNIIYQGKLSRQLNNLEEQEKFYKSEIKKDSTSIYNLTSNLDNLERFAREHYLMKRDDEDIYLIVRD